MRKLTIVRNKSFVASLAKMKVYIEDPSSADLVINNVYCRKLGELSNGEIANFEIDDRSARVYVIAGNMSKNYCNDFYVIPEGEEDIVLVGRNKYNPANGNAFRFENNNNEDAKKNRKKGLVIGLIVFILSIAVGVFIGLAPTLFDKAEPKDFTSNGMTVTLTDDFEISTDYIGFTTVYESPKVVLLVDKEPFESYPEIKGMTLSEYGNALIEVFELDGTTLNSKDGLMSFEYSATSDREYVYQCYVYKSEDAFWILQFATVKGNADDYRDEIVQWAKSVKFE